MNTVHHKIFSNFFFIKSNQIKSNETKIWKNEIFENKIFVDKNGLPWNGCLTWTLRMNCILYMNSVSGLCLCLRDTALYLTVISTV